MLGIVGQDVNPRAEARTFVGMVFRGVMTYAEAKETILMTQGQLSWLIKHDMGEPGTLRRLFWKRRVTWECFKVMFKQASVRAVAA